MSSSRLVTRVGSRGSARTARFLDLRFDHLCRRLSCDERRLTKCFFFTNCGYEVRCCLLTDRSGLSTVVYRPRQADSDSTRKWLGYKQCVRGDYPIEGCESTTFGSSSSYSMRYAIHHKRPGSAGAGARGACACVAAMFGGWLPDGARISGSKRLHACMRRDLSVALFEPRAFAGHLRFPVPGGLALHVSMLDLR
jgi:hypothetical protein